MNVFLDTNVLLEALLPSRKHAAKAKKEIAKYSTVISPLTGHLFVYFGQLHGFYTDDLINTLGKQKYTDLGPSEIKWATKYRENNDFEDALQVACAVMSGCKEFVTFDKKLAGLYGKYIKMRLL